MSRVLNHRNASLRGNTSGKRETGVFVRSDRLYPVRIFIAYFCGSEARRRRLKERRHSLGSVVRGGGGGGGGVHVLLRPEDRRRLDEVEEAKV